MKELFEEIKRLLDRGENLVLATIIADHGSAPRGAGARMIVKMDGSMMGTIGGGAVEHQAGQLAMEVLREKQSYSKGFRLTSEQVAGLGMICGGSVVVYFQYVDAGNKAFLHLCDRILEACDRDEDSWLVTDITKETIWTMGLYSEHDGWIGMEETAWRSDPALLSNQAVTVTLQDQTYYSEPLVRSGKVYVFGGGHVAQELVPVLAHLGFPCVVYDDREEFANQTVFPLAERTIHADFEPISDHICIHENDYLVIMTRGHQYDYLLQKQALETPASYIGVMGSRNKKKIIFEKLRADGYAQEDIARFHTPIGLAISAKTPAEIAISIAAELISARAAREGKDSLQES
ncbi:MAG: XdhC/CoxI family protein [Hungatella sp.]